MNDDVHQVQRLELERVMRTSTQDVLVVRLYDEDDSKRGIMLTRASARRLMETVDRFFRDKAEHDVVSFYALDDEASKQPAPAAKAAERSKKVPTCRSCGAEVIWAKTPAGKKCPYDVAVTSDRPGGPGTKVVPVYSLLDGNAERCKPGEEGHASHFSTCPDAQQHSKGGGQ